MSESGPSNSESDDTALADPRRLGAPDWHEAVDPESGHAYFYNDATGESSWTMPAGYANRKHSVGRVRRLSVAEKRTLSMSPKGVGKKVLSVSSAAESLSAWAEGGGGGVMPSSSSGGVLLGQIGGKAATDRAGEETYNQMGSDGEERRHAPDGSGLYTQSEFAAFYNGSLVQWNVAPSPTPAEMAAAAAKKAAAKKAKMAAARPASADVNAIDYYGEDRTAAWLQDKDTFTSGGHNRGGARYRSGATQRGEEEKREDAVRGHHVTATVRGTEGRRTRGWNGGANHWPCVMPGWVDVEESESEKEREGER